MNARRDPDRLIHSFLLEGAEQLDDQIYDAVRAEIDQRRQRVVIGPWRMPDMNKFAFLGLGAAAVVVALIIGTQLLGPAAPGGVGGAPSATPTATPSPTPIGGTVQYRMDGLPATTEIDAVADGASVSGTAVTSSPRGTHTVRLECAARNGDFWIVGGTVEATTLPGEKAGSWSAVFVTEGSPQRIGIWLSVDTTCEGLTSTDLPEPGPENFVPVESGALVPPSDLAS